VERLVVYCADVGSIPKARFGWARAEVPDPEVERESGGLTEIVELVHALVEDLAAGTPVALGFECPLFVPVRDDPQMLGSARPGEGSAFSAQAGATSLTTGLVQAAWILSELRRECLEDAREAFLDWAAFRTARRGLFLWEALVTGPAKGDSHVEDAARAVACFTAALPDPRTADACASTEQLVDVDGPYLVGLSLLDVRGQTMALSQGRHAYLDTHPIDRDDRFESTPAAVAALLTTCP
jgi:hypothetical protein